MKRYLTLGLSLCFLSFISGCCCGGVRGCGFRRFRDRCNPCGGCSSYQPQIQPFGGFSGGVQFGAPMGGACNSCGTGGGVIGGDGFYNGAPPYGGQPGAYYQPNGFGTAEVINGGNMDTAGLPYGTTMLSPGQGGEAPPMTALAKPESLATY